MKKLVLVLAAASALAAMSVRGAGFAILEQSTSGLGRGLAGMTASTDDPSALYFNPASGAWVERPTLVGGNHYLTGNCRFHNDGSTLTGKKSGDFIGQSFIPNLDFVYPIADGLTLNMASSATSGTATNYDYHWMGRYFAVDTNIAVLELQPSISYQLTDNFAVGVGFMAQYADVTIKQAMNTAQYFGTDSRIRMTGDTWSYGYTAGAVYRPFEGTKLGIGYRSKMTHKVDLDARIYHIPTALAGMMGDHYWDDAKLKLNMPQNINFGVQQVITDKLSLMADICWTQWSTMREMKTTFRKGTLTGKSQKEVMKWHDSWRFSVGGEYKLNDKWTLRAGTTFDERAVTNHNTKTCKMPDSNRYWLCMGCSYQWTKNLRIDAAFNHVFFQPSHITQTDKVSGKYIRGTMEGYTNLVSLGFRYEF